MQYWCVFGNKIVNRYDANEVLDIKGESKSDGAEICAYAYHGGENQHWELEYA